MRVNALSLLCMLVSASLLMLLEYEAWDGGSRAIGGVV